MSMKDKGFLEPGRRRVAEHFVGAWFLAMGKTAEEITNDDCLAVVCSHVQGEGRWLYASG